MNWNRRHVQKVVERDDGLGRQKTTRRRHDKRRTKASRRIRKSFRIGKLAAKIQAADEAEEFPERGAVSPDALGEFEFGIPVQQQLSANGRSRQEKVETRVIEAAGNRTDRIPAQGHRRPVFSAP